MTTIDFRNITAAYKKYGTPLSKIYRNKSYDLLWELKLPPIYQSTDKFLLINDLERIYTYWRNTSSTGGYATETWSIIGQVICPHKCTFDTHVSSVGNTFCDLKGTNDTHYRNIICGYKSGSYYWPPAFFQFVKFENINGIYLYAPEWGMIVSNNSNFEEWSYTLDVNKGFNISPYLNSDPFSNDGWTDTWLERAYNNDATDSELFTYKEFNSVIWPTVIITTEDLTINDYFGYSDPQYTTVHKRYMLMPKNAEDRTAWENVPKSGRSGFVYTVSNLVNDNTVSYQAILPYRSNGW